MGDAPCADDLTCHPELGCVKVCSAEMGVIEVWSNADLDELRGCEVIDGSLRIEGEDIETLDALGELRILENYLGILGCPLLGSLEGLSQLDRIGGTLLISGAPELAALRGLEGVRTIGSDAQLHEISLEGNSKLSDISAIAGAAMTVGALYVSGNDELTTLDGLPRLTSAQFIYISLNPKVSSVNILSELASCDELTIDNNTEMAALDLDALEEVGSFSFAGNGALEELALPNLESATNLLIAGNQSLRSVALPILRSVSNGMVIESNPALTSLGTLEALSIVGELTIHSNPAFPQCFVDALDTRLDACPSAACTGNDETATCR